MKKKEIIVYTSGTWDLFHIGHLNILEKSAALGDKLIVGVSTDELIYSYKGIKPVIPFEERMRIIEAIGVVSKVVPQEILTDIRQLKEFDVDIVTIGDDWRNKYLEGLEWMKSQPDKQVVYLPYTGGISTTSIKKTIIDNANAIILANLEREQRDWTGKDNTNSTPEK
jgi:glycerol-3-phosphate cytidylyltransferase